MSNALLSTGSLGFNGGEHAVPWQEAYMHQIECLPGKLRDLSDKVLESIVSGNAFLDTSAYRNMMSFDLGMVKPRTALQPTHGEKNLEQDDIYIQEKKTTIYPFNRRNCRGIDDIAILNTRIKHLNCLWKVPAKPHILIDECIPYPILLPGKNTSIIFNMVCKRESLLKRFSTSARKLWEPVRKKWSNQSQAGPNFVGEGESSQLLSRSTSPEPRVLSSTSKRVDGIRGKSDKSKIVFPNC